MAGCRAPRANLAMCGGEFVTFANNCRVSWHMLRHLPPRPSAPCAFNGLVLASSCCVVAAGVCAFVSTTIFDTHVCTMFLLHVHPFCHVGLWLSSVSSSIFRRGVGILGALWEGQTTSEDLLSCCCLFSVCCGACNVFVNFRL